MQIVVSANNNFPKFVIQIMKGTLITVNLGNAKKLYYRAKNWTLGIHFRDFIIRRWFVFSSRFGSNGVAGEEGGMSSL